LDAIALAEKHGHDPQVWQGNVADALLMKSNPEYYNDPVCKYGYFRGKQTTAYVEEVMAFYEKCKKQLKAK
jgi:membrane-bound lytic murein transglycosylase F